MRRPILVAEDNALNYELVREVLGAAGYDVVWAGSGEESLRRIRDGYDLLLLDLHMPGVDGFQVLEAVRSDSRLADLAVIVLTADAMQPVAERARALGADGFITKPIEVSTFLAEVDLWAGGRHARQPAASGVG